ncbi:cytidylyltransferase domain-containing protein [Planctomycetota bacterium]
MGALGIIQARFGSTRLRGKILKPLAAYPMLYHVVARSRAALDRVIVATSTHAADDAVEAFCGEYGIECFRGAEDDVLDRYYQVALPQKPDIVVRITADCPLVSIDGIDEVVKILVEEQLDYCMWDLDRIPLGLGAEAMRFDALARTWQDAVRAEEREHVTLYMRRHAGDFKIRIAGTDLVPNRNDLRLTVDTPEDYQVLKAVYDELYVPGSFIGISEAAAFLDLHPGIKQLNANITQKKV